MKYSSENAGRFRVVRVFDQNGIEQLPTYPKRARGLIKNGRAKWLGEDSIVLIDRSSSDVLSDEKMNYSEDKTMSELRNITVTALLECLEGLGDAAADADNASFAEVIGKLYTDTLDVIKDIRKQDQEVILANLSAGCSAAFDEDGTVKSLLARLADIVNALAECGDVELSGITGKLYSETLSVIKDIAKQNQEVVLAQIKAAK